MGQPKTFTVPPRLPMPSPPAGQPVHVPEDVSIIVVGPDPTNIIEVPR